MGKSKSRSGKAARLEVWSTKAVNGEYIDANGVKRKETFFRLPHSLLIDPAYLDLTMRQRQCLTYCYDQFYGKRKPEQDFPEILKQYGGDLFYFPWNMAQKYGYTCRKYFYDDIGVLIGHGFIEVISNGRTQHKKSIYRFSCGWKTYIPDHKSKGK